jgi:hypothetical protein
MVPAVERVGERDGLERAQKSTESTESAESRKEHSTDSTEEGEKAKIPPLPGLVQHLPSRHKHKQPGQLGLLGRQQRLSIGNRCRLQSPAHPPINIMRTWKIFEQTNPLWLNCRSHTCGCAVMRTTEHGKNDN